MLENNLIEKTNEDIHLPFWLCSETLFSTAFPDFSPSVGVRWHKAGGVKAVVSGGSGESWKTSVFFLYDVFKGY